MKVFCLLSTIIIILLILKPQQDHIVYTTSDWRSQFCTQLIHRLGNTNPKPSTITTCVEWTLSEDSSDNAWLRNNPLNTTLCTGSDTGSCTDAVEATLQTITNGYYNDVITAFVTDSPPEIIRQTIWESPWASSRYGYGDNWGVLSNDILDYGFTFLGYPYVYGADRNSRTAFDCSSFVRALILDTRGKDIGLSTYTQIDNLMQIDYTQLQETDLVYWNVPGDQHVGMLYFDKEWMVLHASNANQGVRVDTLASLNANLSLIGYYRW